ncbi:MAG: phosphoribosylamine--glycine ligase [Actinobacteria bacterium]|nr:phosphoribosylamine--glycine ligase [Actinomycetota bacterium]
MRIFVLGSGGRESALVWGLARSSSADELIAMPGNPGIARHAETIQGDPVDVGAVVTEARRLKPDLVVVGPEAPLVAGVGDALRGEGFSVFGPDAAAARIEGSKAYCKELMDDASIGTAGWEAFETVDGAIVKLDEFGPPYVVKADGLAAGKGVVVTSDRDEAIEAVRERLSGERFGDAGRTVVIEEFLDGEEVSLIAFSDGSNLVACEPAQDYKRVSDGDRGPNTGGMGSYSPVPACPPGLADDIVESVIRPMVRATAGREAPFVGALYAGLALTSRGPRVVEFNARFGDPETQALIPRLDSDLAEVCAACAAGSIEGYELTWSSDACVSVVLASGGYPGAHATGRQISGLDEVEADPRVQVFHAGTAIDGDRLLTAGGRVLAVSALGEDYGRARARAYEAADRIRFEGKHLRRDIALKAQDASEEVG